MNRPHMDENDLARFLDGALSEEQRASAVAHLSDSEPDAELLADAAYLLRELGAQKAAPAEKDAEARHLPTNEKDTGSNPKVVELRPPSTTRARPRRVPARWLALAAVLAGVLLTPLALSRFGSRGPAGPGDYAALLSHPGAGLPEGWLENPAWSVTRGGPGGDPSTETDEGVAARIGALSVELELAVASRNAEQADLLCGRIEGLWSNVRAGGPFPIDCGRIVAEAGQPAAEDTPALRQGGESLAQTFLYNPHFALGAWAEAARLAAARRDAGFFEAKRSRRALDGFAQSDDLAQPAREAAQQVRAQLRSNGPANWPALRTALDRLLVAAHESAPVE